MHTLLPVLLMLWQPSATPQATENPCPLTEAQVTQVTGLKVVSKELRPWTFGVTQCVYTMERGTVQFQQIGRAHV